MLRRWNLIVVLAVSCAGLATVPTIRACPFCSAVAQTFTEEVDSMDVAVVAKLLEAPAPKDGALTTGDELPKATFVIQDILKGDTHLKGLTQVQAIYFGGAKPGTFFMLTAVDPPNLVWSTPLTLSPRAREYLIEVTKLSREYAKTPEAYAERLEFFAKYLEDSDELLARDSYDEFARAPYNAVQLLKDKMDQDQLVGWIRNPDVPASRRRLYLTMLGVCGGTDNLPMLEEMLGASDRKQKAGLDALIGCYLTIKGSAGMDLVEDLFIKNEKAEYADTYAAIMALRFHGTEGGVIPRPRVLQGFRLMLERPKLADLVIPDLARWEDWESMPKLVQLFKDADEKTSWVRVPVINYLRACPLPAAEGHLKELEKVDPVAFRRATTFFPPTAPDVPGVPKP